MARLSVSIMAHESRAHLLYPLADKLDRRVTLCVDDGSLGRWGNGRRSLLTHNKESTHHMVLQDDAVIPQDLVAGIEAWLDVLPACILVLYTGRIRAWREIHNRHAQPPCFLQMTDIQWGVAIVMPTSVIPLTVKQGDKIPKIDNYDMRLGLANKTTFKLPVLYPSPSWVDHMETPSTVPGRKPNRFALNFLGEDKSVFDWAPIGEAPIIRVPDFRRKNVGQQLYGRL